MVVFTCCRGGARVYINKGVGIGVGIGIGMGTDE